MERAENDVMNYPPRKNKGSLFAGKMGVDIIIQGVMQTALVMASYCIGNYLFGANHEVGMTMAFVTLCLIQLFHAYNLKSRNNSIFHKDILSNKFMNLSFVVGLVLILAVTLIPGVKDLFHAADRMLWQEWLIAIGLSLAIIPLVEIQKFIEKAIEKSKEKKQQQE